MKISELFDVEYPKTLIYSQMTPCKDGINFVSSQEKNNGVVGKVEYVEKLKIYPSGVITVPLKGSVMMAHLQTKSCYVAHQIAVLSAKSDMSMEEKLFYCLCIRHNSFRFNFGRQADNTLKDIEVPAVVPEWVFLKHIAKISSRIVFSQKNIDVSDWKEFRLEELFNIKYGVNLELSNCEEVSNNENGINFVARTAHNNGVVAKVRLLSDVEPQPAGLITCAGGGSVLSTFVQRDKFYSGRDLYTLDSKENLNIYQKLFCCQCIKINAYKYAYGRQANKTLRALIIKLPTSDNKKPDWDYMEKYMKSLPYSDRISR